MVNEHVRVLVIAPPGLWRDSLRVLLLANHRVIGIDEVGDLSSGQMLFKQNNPGLILLDASLQDVSISEMVQTFSGGTAGRPCIVLTHTSHQEQAARAAGASAVLPEGFSTIALNEALNTAIPIR